MVFSPNPKFTNMHKYRDQHYTTNYASIHIPQTCCGQDVCNLDRQTFEAGRHTCLRGHVTPAQGFRGPNSISASVAPAHLEKNDTYIKNKVHTHSSA